MSQTTPPPRRTGNVLFGLLALVPATVLLLTGYVVPTVRMVLDSFTDARLERPGRNVGLDNYTRGFGDFASSTVGPILFAVAVTATAVIFGGGSAYLAARGGRWARVGVRAAVALPIAAMATTALAVSWLMLLDGKRSFTPLLYQYMAFFGLTVGLAATGYLLVFRRTTGLRSSLPGALLITGITAATALAVGLQAFGFLFALRPAGRTRATPAMLVFDDAFRFFRFGSSSADAVLLWLPLAVLGVAVTVWVILARARVTPVDTPDSPRGAPGWSFAAFAVAGALGLLALIGLGPWLLRSVSFSTTSTRVLIDGGLPVHLVNTWMPPLISTVLGVVAAALAGYGIGALRPLGTRSELLLLPFAPWLFVGTSVLAPDAWFHRTIEGSGFIALIPPGALSIPVLVGSALVFRGSRWLLALPLVGLAAVLTWVAAAQDTLWPLIAGNDGSEMPMPSVILRIITSFRTVDDVPMGWLYPLPVLLIVAALVAAVQILVLDRLALRTGRPGAQEGPGAGF